MYIKLAIIFTFLFFFGSISLFYVSGQLESCKLFRSCTVETLSNGCRQTVRWTRCDDTLGYRETACLNGGCIAGCECDCAQNGYGQSWENTCTNQVHNNTYECRGCPTPTPTPPPGGGCRSGFTIKGEKFEEGDLDNICSPCDPDPSEVFMCQQSGGTYDYGSCQCGQSPIVIDVLGNNFNLTNAASGVQFDITATELKSKLRGARLIPTTLGLRWIATATD